MSQSLIRVLAAIVACACGINAHAQTFSNSQRILAIDFLTTPYPSNISVSGVTEPVGSVSITLNNASFSQIQEIVAAVRGPDGTIYPLISGCANGSLPRGIYTFVPRGRAPTFQPTPGTYVGTICSAGFSLFNVSGPVADLERIIGSTNVNGTWSLFIADRVGEGSAGAVDGWSITFGPVPSSATPTPNSIIYQGRLSSGDGPAFDPVVATFRLFDAPTGGSRVGAAAIARVTPDQGLFSVPLDFGPNIPFNSETPRWLEVEIGGQLLLPRQPILPAPRALFALSANVASSAASASFANTAGSATTAQTADSALTAQTATSAQTAIHAQTADVATTAASATNATNATNATSALNATNAINATNAVNADTADFATAAGTVPWAGIANIPFNVADLRVAPANLPNSALINGSLGLGAQPLASSRLHAAQPSLGATDWHIELTNASALSFRGGIRISNAGFLDVTNNAGSAVGFFARLNSTGAWTVASDARLKTDVRPATGMLDTALKLRPVFFHWLNEDNSTEDFGLIAQEVQTVLPRLVTGDESKDTLTVNYSQLSVVAIAAIQELKAKHEAEVEILRAEIESLHSALEARDRAHQEHIDTLQSRLERLEAAIESTSKALGPRELHPHGETNQ